MTIQLTKKQQEAVEICLKRYKDKEPYTVVAGYAGTGKSTVIKFVVDALGLKKDDVRYAKLLRFCEQKGIMQPLSINIFIELF